MIRSSLRAAASAEGRAWPYCVAERRLPPARRSLRDCCLETAGRIHDRYSGVRILPEVGLFGGYLIRENYGNRPEASGLLLYPVVVVCRNRVVPTWR